VGVSYDRDQRARAKQEGLHLVTLDITGVYAKKEGVSYQGFLFTDEQINQCWKFFEYLALGREFQSTPAPAEPVDPATVLAPEVGGEGG
jgi:hypothetical protein